jgi:hypothetical protein
MRRRSFRKRFGGGTRQASRVIFVALAVCGVACGPSTDEKKALASLERQGRLCDSTSDSLLGLWESWGPSMVASIADAGLKTERAQIAAGEQVLKPMIERVARRESERDMALLAVYEETAKLCRLAMAPEGSRLTYSGEKARAVQDFEGKLARAKALVGPIGSEWGAEWEASTAAAKERIEAPIRAAAAKARAAQRLPDAASTSLEPWQRAAAERLLAEAARAEKEEAREVPTTPSELYLEEGWKKDAKAAAERKEGLEDRPEVRQFRQENRAVERITAPEISRRGEAQQPSASPPAPRTIAVGWQQPLRARVAVAHQVLYKGSPEQCAVVCRAAKEFAESVPRQSPGPEAALLDWTRSGADLCLAGDRAGAQRQFAQVLFKIPAKGL